MNTQRKFLSEVEEFLALAGISPSRFGREAIGDPNFVLDLRGGRAPGLNTADRVRAYIRDFNVSPPSLTPNTAAVPVTNGAVTANDFMAVDRDQARAEEEPAA